MNTRLENLHRVVKSRTGLGGLAPRIRAPPKDRQGHNQGHAAKQPHRLLVHSNGLDAVNETLTYLIFLQVLAQNMLRHRFAPRLFLKQQSYHNSIRQERVGRFIRRPKKRKGPAQPDWVGPFCWRWLRCGDVFSLIALGSLFDLELNHLAFVKCLVSLHLYGGEVNEHVFARLALDESIPFRCVKPLHYTLFSAHLLDSSFMSDRYLPRVTPVGGRIKPIVYSHPSRLALKGGQQRPSVHLTELQDPQTRAIHTSKIGVCLEGFPFRDFAA